VHDHKRLRLSDGKESESRHCMKKAAKKNRGPKTPVQPSDPPIYDRDDLLPPPPSPDNLCLGSIFVRDGFKKYQRERIYIEEYPGTDPVKFVYNFLCFTKSVCLLLKPMTSKTFVIFFLERQNSPRNLVGVKYRGQQDGPGIFL
jgi:hypothetical protein